MSWSRFIQVPHQASLLLVLLLLCSPTAPAAQDQVPPAIEAHRAQQAPVIDGRLDEAVWQGVQAVTGFWQKEPAEGQPATEETRIRILYDQSHLYVGIELAETAQSDIRATEMRRDNSMESDDTFTLLLDTFHDHRNAFVFRLNPLGTRFDALVRNESDDLDSDWDEQWTAAAAVGEQGWSAEFAIPFKVLRFDADREQVWGVNFERLIKRKNESAYWAGWDRNYRFTHVSQAGHLVGLQDIKQGERLRIRPYVVAGVEALAAVASPEGTRWLRDVGLDDLKYAVTSNLTADLAVNPDFAQTEVDTQQVNLTRFSLFFPEKRQFFIEGAESLRMGVGSTGYGSPPLDLFYSRRVGLSPGGVPIPVLAGGKLTGKVGGFDVGVLNVQTDTTKDAAGENFGVARLRKELFQRSYVGGIFTNRYSEGRFNRVVGADARFVLKDHFTLTGLAAKALTSATGESGWTQHLGADWTDDFFHAAATYLKIDPEFDPGIGFVERHDRMISTEVSVKPRPGGRFIRQFEFTPAATFHHNAQGVLETRELEFEAETAFQSGDEIHLAIGNSTEQLPDPFEISDNVILPPGLYRWNTFRAGVMSFEGRAVSGRIMAEGGGFYNGTRRSLEIEGGVRLSEHLSFDPSYNFNDIDLTQGSFNTHLLGVRANVSFTTNLLTSAYLQYNSEGELANLQLRVNYIFRTIDNFYIVVNETRFTGGLFDGLSNRSLVIKTTYSLHR